MIHVSYAPTGRSLVFATEEGVVALFETAAGRITPLLDLETAVEDIAWSPHAESIAVLDGEQVISSTWKPCRSSRSSSRGQVLRYHGRQVR